MKPITIGHYKGKRMFKLQYTPDEIASLQLYKAEGVFYASPMSNIALGYIPSHISGVRKEDILRLRTFSDRCAVAGAWSTTSGAKYVFANILANPNITKLVLYSEKRDNTHLLMDACEQFWKHGASSYGIIKGAKAMNPRFDLPLDALERVRKQADLVLVRNVSDYNVVRDVLHACYQEPEHAVSCDAFPGVTCVPPVPLCDEGARFDAPYFLEKDYVHEHGIYFFETAADAATYLPKIVFSQGTMKQLKRTTKFDLAPGYSYYITTMPLVLVHIAKKRREAAVPSGFSQIAGDVSTEVFSAKKLLLATMDMQSAVLSKSDVLRSLGKLSSSLLVLCDVSVIVRGDKH